MGEVYKAQDSRLDRTVAIKILPPGLASSVDARARFEREAKAVAGLSHPHICALYDVGREGDTEYLVMEFLEGETLGDRLARGPLVSEQALRFGAEIADALDKAHRQGIVHRDLKPGNVMLTKSGVKLLDFGLAKGLEAPASGTSMTALPTKAAVTQEGTILGTFQYMAPEQLEGRPADSRTDIFALGAVLYEMTTGRKAFSGTSQASLISAIMTREPQPISAIEPMAPPALDRVVRTCLAKDPEDRWQSAGDVAKELKWISGEGSQAGAPAAVSPRRGNRERVAWILATAATLVALASAAAFVVPALRKRPAAAPRTWSFLLPPDNGNFEVEGDTCGSLTISPDGRWVTFASRRPGGKVMLWLRALEDPAARPIPGTEGASFPFWSPDSQHLAFFSTGKLERVDLRGSPAIVICDAPNGRSGSWSRDGVILFSPDTTTEIFQVAAAGGPARPVTKLDRAHGETTHRWATFLPDGKHFLYMAASHTMGTAREVNGIYRGSIESSGTPEKTRVLDARSNVVFASGYLLSMRQQVLVAQRFDPVRARLSGDPVSLADGVRFDQGYFRGTFSVSDGGILVYATGAAQQSTHLQWFDLDAGKPVGDPIGEPAEYTGISSTPDGSRIAATIVDPTSGRPDLWLIEGRDARTRLTFGGSISTPVFSPDGKRIAYAKHDPQGTTVFVKSASGGGLEQPVQQFDADVRPNDWSRDGRYLALDFLNARGKTREDIWILPMPPPSADGGVDVNAPKGKPFPFLATEAVEQTPTFSPDGRWMAYISDESGRPELYAASFPSPGRKLQISSEGSLGGTWLGGGRIAYGSLDGRTGTLVEIRETPDGLELGARKTFDVAPMGSNPTFTADGRRALFASRTESPSAARIALVTNWAAGLPRD